MGYKLGMPSLKLNNVGNISKHCGDFGDVAREALGERIGHDPDIDRDRAALNRYTGFQTAAELQEYSRQHCETLRDAKGRKLRKDAVVMCATIIKPPAAYMATLSLDDQRRFLDDAYAAFAEIVGQDNIKSRADHFDELGAHTHNFWEPMTEDGRLCAKEMHNLKFFGRVNREMPQKLREKGWDIDDCEMYDAAKEEYDKAQQKQAGRSSVAFKADAEKKKAELIQEIEDLEKRKSDADDSASGSEAMAREMDLAAEEAAQRLAEKQAEELAVQEQLRAQRMALIEAQNQTAAEKEAAQKERRRAQEARQEAAAAQTQVDALSERTMALSGKISGQEAALTELTERKAELEGAVSDFESRVRSSEGRILDLDIAYRQQEQLYRELAGAIDHNKSLIQDQQYVLGLIEDYQAYQGEAQDLENALDLAEEMITEQLPKSTKLFKHSEASNFLKVIEDLFSGLREIIERLILRLQIYEEMYPVPEKLSEPAQQRAASLDNLIAVASNTASQAAPKGRQKTQEQDIDR